MRKIRIGIVGFGNLGKSILKQVEKSDEFELVAVFSRRAISPQIPFEDIEKYKGKIDVLFICVGSTFDCPKLAPAFAKNFNIVDSYDNHANMKKYAASIDKIARENGKTAISAAGWDPGFLSIIRALFATFISEDCETFWGPGVSLGHTNAIKNVPGVLDAAAITLPNKRAVECAKSGMNTTEPKHKRVCYVKASSTTCKERIEQTIKNMPKYFKGQEVHVIFTDTIPKRTSHAGLVIAKGANEKASLELELENNAEFTAKIMLRFGAANYLMQKRGLFGGFLPCDIAAKYLCENAVDLV